MNNPIKDGCRQDQGFGANATAFYRSTGLAGHPGIDRSCGYGSEILSPVNGTVISLFTPERPASDGYTAIFILCRTKLEWFEFSVGHVSQIAVRIGQEVKVGDLLGYEGNKGVVYSNGQRITLAMQWAGDRRGSHRHYQKRVLNRVRRSSWGTPVIRDARGVYRDSEGFLYAWADPKNRFASCVDPTAPVFTRQLERGSQGYQVTLLQRAIGMPESLQTGIYGPKTAEAVRAYQVANGLSAVGIVGPQTRALLNSTFGQLVDP